MTREEPPAPPFVDGPPGLSIAGESCMGSSASDPFDPDAATGPTRRVMADQVVDLLHVTHAPETINAYATAMAAGERFPPISVLPLGRKMFITDGHKRFNAGRALGIDQMTVELWSLRRLTADLWRQTTIQLRGAGAAFARASSGRDGRREAGRFVAKNLAHWRRIARSLWRLFRNPRSRP